MIAIPFVYFSLLLGYTLLQKKKWSMDAAAITLLILISFFAIIIDVKDLYGDYGINEQNYNLPTVILFCIQWTIILIPIKIIAGMQLLPHLKIKENLLKALIIIVTICSITMVIVMLSDIKEALIMDIADVRGTHYQNLKAGGSDGANYFMLIPTILSSTPFPTLALFFWFYLSAYTKCSKILTGGILFASIVQAILAIVMAGRAAMIYWMFDFFILYSFFYDKISKSLNRKILLVVCSLGIIMALLFISITIARFGISGSNRDPFDSLYGYAGQHIDNFCTVIRYGGSAPISIDRIFPLTNKILTGHNFDLYEHYQTLGKYMDIWVSVFDTFGGEIYLDLGWIGYILFFLAVIIFSYMIKYYWKEIKFYDTFLFIIIVSFFTRSLFAWPFTGHYITLAIIFILILRYIFKYIIKF